MRLAIISCAVFTRVLSDAVARTENSCRIFYLDAELHLTPSKMRSEIQRTIDLIEKKNTGPWNGDEFKAIVLLCGLCSGGSAGIYARSIPVVIPRADDCMAIFLGSQKRYMKIFREYKGRAYWMNSAWIDEGTIPDENFMARYRKRLLQKYDADTVDYILETEFKVLKEYSQLVYVHESGESPQNICIAKTLASYRGWEFQVVAGDRTLIEDLIAGRWDTKDCIVVPPNHKAVQSNDERKFVIALGE